MVKTITSNERKVAKLKSDRCIICGENRIAALTSMEVHHLIGNKEGLTITVCQNCHKEYEYRKEFWPEPLLNKDRPPYYKSLAYLLSVCDFVSMHGEQLLNSFNVMVDNNLDADIKILNCKMKVSKIIYIIGSLMIHITKIIVNALNKVSVDKETENIVNSLLIALVPKLKIFIEYFKERGIRYD